MTATDTRPRCEAAIGYENRSDGFGSVAIPCSQVVGVHRWLDIRGERHAACYRHAEARMRRYPPAEPDEIEHARHIRDGADPDCHQCERTFEYYSGALA